LFPVLIKKTTSIITDSLQIETPSAEEYELDEEDACLEKHGKTIDCYKE
jgi:hypothetical protein